MTAGQRVLVTVWECRTCEAGGEGKTADRDAEKHGKQTSHPTITNTRWELT